MDNNKTELEKLLEESAKLKEQIESEFNRLNSIMCTDMELPNFFYETRGNIDKKVLRRIVPYCFFIP